MSASAPSGALPTSLACGLVLFAGLASPARGADVSVANTPGREEAEQLRAGREDHDGRSFVVLPIPQANPALGTGVVLAAVVFYQPEGSVRPWMTGAGALWTDNGSRGGGLFQKAYLGGDRWRLTALAAQAELQLKFYGIGEAAADRGRSIDIEQKPTFYRVDLLRKVAESHFLGLRLQQVDMTTRIPLDLPDDIGVEIPTPELEMALAGPGLVYEYDTRDAETGPTRGLYVDAAAMWNLDGWGSDREYAKATVAANHYRPLGPDGVLALRGYACSAGDDAPFFDLCLFGSGADLRGYEGGQFRDYTLLAFQGEYRWQFARRWGAVFFAGVGDVAPSFGDYRFDDLLPSGGLGLRFKASTEYNVNIRLDYARGKDGDAVYFSIGEAF
ncbi:BamA/TamA family outer membrane protein [Lysobacter sp. SG-8]|uniref:BamA/TamA family outer membrane protein n=1 Tax=Marilutibacter penaei TaxID=2759900 RepID=A0A7W3U1N0_9GAMM|nr:BamA/TamA family outer membrane protein [Lysobacter penaei]MBB1087244.1 BamA/TamA family outer membrane protein [Lysobacter penaei]